MPSYGSVGFDNSYPSGLVLRSVTEQGRPAAVNMLFPQPKSPLRQVFFPNRLLDGFAELCADLYADTPLTRFSSAFGFLFSLLLF